MPYECSTFVGGSFFSLIFLLSKFCFLWHSRMCSLEVLVDPLDALGQDASVCCSLFQVGHLLVLTIQAQEVVAVVRRAVSNYDLRRVFVRHHDRGLRQLRSLRVRAVRSEWLLGHAGVVVLPRAVNRSRLVKTAAIGLTWPNSRFRLSVLCFGKKLGPSSQSSPRGIEQQCTCLPS